MAAVRQPTGDRPFRILPVVTDENAHFWLGGAHGHLWLLRCTSCGWWLHPPAPVCPVCLSRELAVSATSGRGVVHAVTVNWQPWIPGFEPPYAVAIVELAEQAGLRVTSNVIGVPPEEVAMGAPVRVVFEEYDGVWLPLFEPDPAGAPS